MKKVLAIFLIAISLFCISPAAYSLNAQSDVKQTYTATKVSGLKASSIKSTSVKLSWNKISNAKGYKIFKYIKAQKKYVLLGKTSSTSFTVKNLKEKTDYAFAVAHFRVQNGKTLTGAKSALLTVKTVSIKSAYKSVIKSWAKKDSYSSYHLFDVNNDGTKELIILYYGPSSRDESFVWYTYKNGSAKKICSTNARGEELYFKGKQLYTAYTGFHGAAGYSKILYKSGKIIEKQVELENEVNDYGEYERILNYIENNFTPLDSSYCTDYSLLNRTF